MNTIVSPFTRRAAGLRNASGTRAASRRNRILEAGESLESRLALAVVTPFDVRYSTNDTGDITFASNTIMTAPGNTPEAIAARNGTGPQNTLNDDYWNMVYVDIDGDSTTFNSSSSTLDLPAGAEVLFAGLYWGGRARGAEQFAAWGSVKFRGPDDAGYQNLSTTITSSTTQGAPAGSGARNYQSFKDVTDIVRAQGEGSYTVANVQAYEDNNFSAGWSLVVVYRDETTPPRNLTVFDGFAYVTTSDPDVNIPISGFRAPPSGPVDATLGFVSYEGDLGITGDRAYFNGGLGEAQLSNATNPPNNFFNSSISDRGVTVTSKNPDYVNQLGFGADLIEADGLIANNATTANIRLTTTQDFYYPGVITTAINVYAPKVTVSKSVTDVNGGIVEPGDVLRYAITVANDASAYDTASNVVLTDVMPALTTYRPGTLVVSSGANAGPKTDAVDADQAEFLSGSDTVRFRLGAGAAGPPTGGSLAPGQSSTATFEVTVDDGFPTSAVIANLASLSYAGTFFGPFTRTAVATITCPPVADLAIAKTDGSPTYVPGGNVTYTLTVTNNGAATVSSATVDDVLPVGTTLVSAAGGSYDPATRTVTFTTGTLAAGGTQVFTLTVLAASSRLGDLVNTATVKPPAGVYDPNPANNSSTDTNTAAPLANLTITKTDEATTVLAGGGTVQTYTLRVRNLGLSDSRNVVVNDTWPAGFQQGVLGVPTQGTVTPGAGGNFTWSLGTLVAGAEAVLTVTYTVPASTLPGTYTNTATVTSTTPDPDPNNTATDSTAVTTSANLTITKTDGTSTVLAGGGTIQTYTLTVQNNGASDAQNVVVNDVWPAGFTQGAFGLPSQGTVTPGMGGNFAWSIGKLTAGGLATLQVSYTVPASTAAGLFTNTATVTSTTPDPVPGNNTANDTTTVTTSANLTIAKTDATTTVTAGGGTVQIYTLTVRNLGASDARDVAVNDSWPAGFQQGVFGLPSQGSVTPGVGGNFAWAIGTLAAGGVATLTVAYTVPASTLPGDYTNTATVTSTTPDPDPSNTATDTTAVIASANLTITKDDGVTTVLAGGGTTQTYTLRVRNNGVSDAQSVVVNDTWPAGFTRGAFGIPSQGTVASGPGSNFAWSLGTLAAGAEATLTVSYTVPASTLPGAVVNTAIVSSPTPDPDPSNTATDTTIVTTSANLTITKTDSATTVIAGDGITHNYLLTVTNLGVSDSQGVIVTDTWPGGFVQAGIDTPSQGTVTPGIGGNFTWTVGTLPAGGVATLVVFYTVPAATPPGAYVNTAVVTSDTFDPDPDNTATDTTTVIATPDLSITKTDGVATVVAGDGTTQTYTLTVKNNGVSDARGVVVTDVWPADFSQGAVGIPSQGTVSPGVGGNFTWTVGTLSAGGTATLTVTYTVAASVLPGPRTNSVSVTSIDDPEPHTATDTTTVLTSADLTVTKTDSTTTVTAGSGTVQTYLIQVQNAGVSDAQGVVLTDVWPAGFQQGAFGVPDQGTVTPGVAGNFTWSIGTLAAGQLVTLQVTSTVPASTLPGAYINEATVTSETPDPDPNNTGSDTTTVITSADLTITKDDGVTAVLAGGGTTQTYTISVRNNGVSDARDVVVTDIWPTGFTQTGLGVPSQGSVIPGAEGNFTWTLGTIAAGGLATLTATYTVPAATLPGSYVNTATVSSTTPDPDPANTATDTTTVTALANLVITKDDGVTTVLAGGGTTQTYTILLRNIGASDARDVAVNDVWPAGFAPAGLPTPSQGTVTPGAGGNFSWTVGTLAAGGQATVTATYTVPASTLPGDYVNAATVSTSTPDANPVDTATDSTTVTALADVSITKTDLVTSVVAGGGTTQTYTLRVKNNGLGFSDAQNVSVADVWPAGFEQGGFGVPSQGTVTPGVGGNFTWSIGTLAQGAEATLTVTYTVPVATLPGIYTNTAAVTSTTPDPDPNNTATDNTTVVAVADLSVTKTDGTLTYKSGGTTTYTIVVANAGPSFVTGATVIDIFPPQIASATWTVVYVGVGSSGVAGGSGSINTAINLAAGGTATFTVQASISDAARGDMINTVTVTPPVGTTDPNPDNNSATDINAYDGPINPTADVGALVIGTDDGCNLASWVKVIDPVTGTPLVQFLAYEASFLGSVRVATGDLTGDGLDEIVVAPGRNRVGEVRVFTQQGVELPQYRLLPFSAAYLGGVEVAVGDVNGDGFGDIIAGQSSGAGRVSVFLVNPAAADPVANSAYRAFRPFPSPYALGVMVSAGDFGTYSAGVRTSPLPDGRAEIVVGTNAGTRAQVRIYDASTATPKLVKTILPFASTFQGGVTLSTGRYNFDTIDDVMIGAGVGGNSVVEVYDGTTWALRKKIDAFASFARPTAAVFATMLDLDGDGRADDVYGVQGRNATGGSNGVKRWNRITSATNTLPQTTTLAPPLRIASIVLRVSRSR